jgi:type I restriction enzyme M protein
MLSNTLKSKVNNLWDKFWSSGISNPISAIEQISYLLFMKRLDENDRRRENQAEFTHEAFTSIFKGFIGADGKTIDEKDEANKDKLKIDKATLRWSHFAEMTHPDEKFQHVQSYVFPFIKQLGESTDPFAKHMENAVFLIPKASLLDEATRSIDDIYKEIEREEREEGQKFQDNLGDLYEYLLNEISKSGKNGQFRTPRHIIQMICGLLNPQWTDSICDPSCGTGGFLLGAYLHILSQNTSDKRLKINDDGFRMGTFGDKISDPRVWEKIKNNTFFGFDFDTTMVRVGLMNLMLHGIDNPQINYMDTLSKKYTESERYTLILANPPFKGSIDRQDKNTDLLKAETFKTELLFVERIFHSLAKGGRAGVIIPDGVLFGSSKAHVFIRKLLIYQCQLEAVISMPSGIFKPYAGVSTGVLVFTKVTDKMPKKAHTKQVWFYNMTADGYSLDDKRAKKDDSDLQDIIKSYNNRHNEPNNDRTAKHFFIPAEEIIDNDCDLSINRYKVVNQEEIEYKHPSVIMKEMRLIERDISTFLSNLENLVK